MEMQILKESKGLLFLLGLLLVIVFNSVFVLILSTMLYFAGGYESFGSAVLNGVTVWMVLLGADKLLRDALDLVKTVRDKNDKMDIR